jgi:hypothetical protein
MSKELLTKLNGDLKLAGYAKRSRQSYVRAVRQVMNSQQSAFGSTSTDLWNWWG